MQHICGAEMIFKRKCCKDAEAIGHSFVLNTYHNVYSETLLIVGGIIQ